MEESQLPKKKEVMQHACLRYCSVRHRQFSLVTSCGLCHTQGDSVRTSATHWMICCSFTSLRKEKETETVVHDNPSRPAISENL